MPLKRLLLIAALTAAPALAQEHAHHGSEHEMRGMFGPYAMSREASGTSWQPEHAAMEGLHLAPGAWRGMLHGFADVIYDRQGGPRGDEKVFVPSMLMAMAGRPLGGGTLGLRGMVSLDPAMGRRGYPLLFQTGETADGVTELVDRQHPHDLFMELAASYSAPVGAGSVFVYGGLPGEPALGPATFMHRASGMAIPEAPLTHHWLDSTHITFGVLTLGVTTPRWKLESSVFNGREPDQSRWNLETEALDSYSGRLTFNPGPAWSAQLSYGYLAEPEQLEPGVAVHRTTASLSWAQAGWSATAAAGINRKAQHNHAGALLELTRSRGAWTAFGRAEWVQNDHLFHSGVLAGREFEIGKLSLGASYELFRAGPLRTSLGALGSAYAFASALEPAYGERPLSAMLFLRAALAGS